MLNKKNIDVGQRSNPPRLGRGISLVRIQPSILKGSAAKLEIRGWP